MITPVDVRFLLYLFALTESMIIDPLRVNRRQQGQRAESIAAHYLIKKGYRIVKQNIYTKFGEIDILAKKNGCYVCVEVRSNYWSDIDPLTSISANKYRHLVRSLLSLDWLHNQPLQIDILAIEKGKVTNHVEAIDAPAD